MKPRFYLKWKSKREYLVHDGLDGYPLRWSTKRAHAKAFTRREARELAESWGFDWRDKIAIVRVGGIPKQKLRFRTSIVLDTNWDPRGDDYGILLNEAGKIARAEFTSRDVIIVSGETIEKKPKT